MATLANGATITPPRVPLIDPRSGQIDRAWYLFFFNLFNGLGLNTTDLSGLQLAPTSTDVVPPSPGLGLDPVVDLTALPALQYGIDALLQAPPQVPAVATSSSQTPPSTITVTASPFSYQNVTGFPADVIVSAGTVSLIEFSRNGTTWYGVGATAGMFGLSPGDRLRVTYTVAPTMTLIPR